MLPQDINLSPTDASMPPTTLADVGTLSVAAATSIAESPLVSLRIHLSGSRAPLLFCLDLLPAEIWDSIFAHACTDGGFTGAALSRTSKQVRTLATRTRYLTIALTSTAQICAFATSLPGLARDKLPRCEYLLLLTALSDAPEALRSIQASAAAQDVLRTLGPGLRVLCVHTRALRLNALFGLVHFPALEDLVWDVGPAPLDFVAERAGGHPLRRLRRLHVAKTVDPRTLRALAPNVEELRVSDVASASALFVALTGVRRTSGASSQAPAPTTLAMPYEPRTTIQLPETLRRILILPASLSAPGARLSWHRELVALRRLRAIPQDMYPQDLRVCLLSPVKPVRFQQEEHMRDWELLARGEDGPWIIIDATTQTDWMQTGHFHVGIV